MKKFLTISLSLLLVPVIGLAATTDFVADGNITVSAVTFGDSTANMLIITGSTAESWTFNSGTFTVTNPDSTSAFKVGSSDTAVKSIQTTLSGTTVACAENSTPGTSYLTLPTASGAYTIVPSTTAACTSLCTALSNTATYNSFPTCGALTCNSGYKLSGSGSSATCVPIGGGGIMGGGGGGSSVPTPVMVTIPGTATTTSVVSTQSPVASTPTATSVATPSLVAQLVSPVFNTTLKYGITSDEVTRLQELLATDSEIYPEGIVSGWFGQLTRKAVQKFQAKYGIVSSGDENTTGYGLVGPKTQAKLNEVFGKASESAQPSAVAISVSPVFSSGLERGMSNSNVKRLQQLLNSDPDTKIAESGVGSSGNETEYFGSLTEKAVQKFQAKYNLAQPGDAGYGYVGPKTRAKLGEVFGE